MLRTYRIIFISLFSIFFIITTPFLVLYSLGYDLDFSRRELNNSITISVDSRPRTADIYSNSNLLLRNSGELRANEGRLVPLTIKQNGYLDENFLIWSGENQNTTARISNVWLLPSESETLDNDSSIEYISLLSKDQVIIKKNSNYYVQLYSFGGVQSNPQPITSPTKTPIQFTGAMPWTQINTNAYWNKQNEILLVKINDSWSLYDTRFLIAKPADIAYLNSSQILILDTKKNLWIWNFTTNQFRFLDSGFDGLSFTEIPNYIWLWKYNTIYRISPNQINNQIQFEDYIFSTYADLSSFGDSSDPKFVVKNVYQGIFVKIDETLVYIPDYDKSAWYIIAKQVKVANAFDNSIIWIDFENQVWVYNLQLKNLENITTMDSLANYDSDSIDIYYYFLWRRIVIYTPDTTQTIWYDKDILNKSIVGYYTKDWIDGIQCHTEVIDRYQFCIENGHLIAYRNTSIW